MCTKINPFKAGDKIIYTEKGSKYLKKGSLYTVSRVTGHFLALDGCAIWYNYSMFSLVTATYKPFTKDMLKPGMRVVLRNEDCHVVGTCGLLNNDGAPARMLWYYSEAGLRELGVNPASLDIMEVWSGPELAVDFFDMSKMGALLFKRVEKAEEELKKEAQLKDIAELEARLAELKAKINT